MSDEDDLENVVINNGSYQMQGGFGGHDAPRSVFRTVVATKLSQEKKRLGVRRVPKQLKLIGDKAEAHSDEDNITISYPLENGQVKSWDAMEKIWHHMFYNELRVAPEEQGVLLTECALFSKASKEKKCQIMMETFSVPKYYVAIQAVLALYASGPQSEYTDILNI